jgi:transcriptional regulator with XRE-family HTH domain
MPKKNHALIALGKSIRKQRTALGLSQKVLAAKARLDPGYISDIERGVRNVSLLSVARIAKALGTSAEALFREIEI